MLSVVLVFSCCIIVSAAEDDTPVIFVPGFIETIMGVNVDEYNEEQLWPFTVETVVGKIASDSPALITLLAGLIFGNFDKLGARLGKDTEEVILLWLQLPKMLRQRQIPTELLYFATTVSLTALNSPHSSGRLSDPSRNTRVPER